MRILDCNSKCLVGSSLVLCIFIIILIIIHPIIIILIMRAAPLQNDSGVQYKHCQIMKTEAGEFLLQGASRSFGSLEDLLHQYQKEVLRTEGFTFQFTKCLPPTIKGPEIHSPHVTPPPPPPFLPSPSSSSPPLPLLSSSST